MEEAVTIFANRSRAAERARTGRALHSGVIGAKDLMIYRYLLGWAVSASGQVFPSMELIVAKAGLGMGLSTAYEAKERLRAAGLLDWLHRCEEAEEPTGPGRPPVRQISNFYRLPDLPKAVEACLSKPRRAAYALARAVTRRAEAARLRKHRADADAQSQHRRRRPLIPDAARMLREGIMGTAPTSAAPRDSS